eukprot:gene9888-9954_t
MLVDSLRRFLADKLPFSDRKTAAFEGAGWSRDVWNQLAELGAIGALFDESVGGFGGSPFDIGVVFGELGRAIATGPWLAALQAGHVLAAAGRVDDLAALIDGSQVIGYAEEEADTWFDPAAITTRATATADGWVLDGAKTVVSCAGTLDRIVVVARGDAGLSTFLVERDAPGMTIRDYLVIDGGSAGDVTFVATPAILVGEAGGAGPVIEEARALGLVALAWEGVAVMDARSAAINAADRFPGDRVERERAASAAKATIGKAGSLVAEEAIQMHGGIGMTWELAMSHYAKRLVMIGHELGDEDHHLARYIELGHELADTDA